MIYLVHGCKYLLSFKDLKKIVSNVKKKTPKNSQILGIFRRKRKDDALENIYENNLNNAGQKLMIESSMFLYQNYTF